ncbi:MAG: ferritin-like domain-containing protein, partial [Phenylobacterium sp.]|nr:ferritin-like domain-containing protein [Phenylobacterium sp.]
LVEGLAMGAFAAGFQYNRDPLARKLFQLVMTDEAFHHKFGKIWADRTIPKMTQEERDIVEDWAAHCFQSLLFNMGSPVQQAAIYTQFGLDPERVMTEMRATYQNDESRRERLKSQTNIFRVLIKTLFNAGLITERTRAFYATYVDMDELKAEGEKMVGDEIAEEGIKYLQEINFRDRHTAPVTIAAE